MVDSTHPPFALSTPAFPFRHLAALAGRAPIGGVREVALGCFVTARLAVDRLPADHSLSDVLRAARCAGARGWLGTLALPGPVRSPLVRCLDLCADGSTASLVSEFHALSGAASAWLDLGARMDLDVLVATLESSRLAER